MKRTLLILIFIAATTIAFAQQSHKLSGTIIGTGASVDYTTNQMSTKVNTKEMAFDGNLNTFFASYARSGTWAGLDLGRPHVITRVGCAPRNDGNGPKRLCLAVFEGANRPDFLDAVPIYMVQRQGVIGQMMYADVKGQQAFRYVRYMGPNDARCNVAEVEFYGYESDVVTFDPAEGEAVKTPADFYYRPTNLPLVVVHTENAQEPYDKTHEIDAYISIISDGKVLTDTATIRLRGNASKDFPKKPYRIKWDEKHHVLGSPAKAKKWTLINNYGDKTLMRNMLAFELSRRFGLPYTPFCTPVDVMINGEYRGCYQLCDQVEVGKGRVEITKMDETCTTGDALTGGYFVEVDAYASSEPLHFWSSKGNPVTIKSPEDDEIVSRQKDYIVSRWNDLESRLFGNSYTSETQGYRSRMDLDSFLKHFLVGELSGNTDTYWSVYFYKDRGDELFHAGPVWDFDLAFENDSRTYPINNKTDWVYRSGGSYAGSMKSFVDRIINNDVAAKRDLLALWEDGRYNRGIEEQKLLALVDEYAALLQESQNLNFLRWPIMNQRVHMNPRTLGSYSAEVQGIKTYLAARLKWIDKKLGFDASLVGLDELVYNDNDNNNDDSAIYTLSGQKVATDTATPLPPGIYIKNGRKVVVR